MPSTKQVSTPPIANSCKHCFWQRQNHTVPSHSQQHGLPRWRSKILCCCLQGDVSLEGCSAQTYSPLCNHASCCATVNQYRKLSSLCRPQTQRGCTQLLQGCCLMPLLCQLRPNLGQASLLPATLPVQRLQAVPVQAPQAMLQLHLRR